MGQSWTWSDSSHALEKIIQNETDQVFTIRHSLGLSPMRVLTGNGSSVAWSSSAICGVDVLALKCLTRQLTQARPH